MIKLLDLLKGTIHDPFTGELYEGLIYTADIQSVSNILKKKYKNDPEVYAITSQYDAILIGLKLNCPNSKTIKHLSNIEYPKISELLQLMNNLGYYPSDIESSTSKKEVYTNTNLKTLLKTTPDKLWIQFEKKYDKVIIPPKFIYHATPIANQSKITKIGLIPKTNSKIGYHPGRVYFGINEKSTIELWDDLKQYVVNKQGILLTIDTTKLSNITFYIDPQADDAIYTYDNIKPESIINIKKI